MGPAVLGAGPRRRPGGAGRRHVADSARDSADGGEWAGQRGGAVQRHQRGEARHIAQHAASEGKGAAAAAHLGLRHCGRGLQPGRDAALGISLRGHAGDQPDDHLRAAVRNGAAGGRTGSSARWGRSPRPFRASRKCQACRSPICRRGSATPSSTGSGRTTSGPRCWRRCTGGNRPAWGPTSTRPRWKWA